MRKARAQQLSQKKIATALDGNGYQQRKTNRAIKAGLIVIMLWPLLLLSQGLENDLLSRAYFQPGLRHYQQGNYQAAEQDFSHYLRWVNDSDVRYHLGLCLVKEGRNSEALEQFRQDVSYQSGYRRLIPYVNSRSRSWIRRLSAQ